MAPVSLPYYIASLFIITSCLLFCNLYFPIYTTKIPKIFILLSLSDLTFASGCEGIDNPFIALVARFLIVCAGTRWLAYYLLLDWYNGSQKLREILTLLCCITLSSSRENQRKCSRGSKKEFWHRCRGVYAKVIIPSTHHKPLSPALHYLPFASRFHLPHFTLAVLFALSLHPPSLSLFTFSFTLTFLPLCRNQKGLGVLSRVLVLWTILLFSLNS